MKTLLIIARIIAAFIAVVFLSFGIVTLFIEELIVSRLVDFIILVSPGLMIIFALIFFRHYYRISGLIFVGLSIIYFVFFRPYLDMSIGWPIITIILLPLFVSGIVYMVYKDSYQQLKH